MRDPISGLRPPPVWVEKIVTLYFGNFSLNKQDFWYVPQILLLAVGKNSGNFKMFGR